MKRLPLVQKKDHAPSPNEPLLYRSVAERDGDPELHAQKLREFAEDRPFEPPPGVDRRTFLGLMGASLALGGLAGCHRPEEKIVPFSHQPEDVIPGRPEYYATSMPLYGTAIGIVVESNDGRPTKVEGNPIHPDSRGGTSAFVQAHVLNLYDPDRSDSPLHNGKEATMDEAWAFLGDLGQKLAQSKGAGLGIIITDHRSETTRAALDTLTKQMPEAKVVKHEAFGREFAKAGTEIAFGQGNQFDTVLHVENAHVIVSFDSDFLYNEGSPIKAAKAFSRSRRVDSGNMNRLYVAEPCPTVTSAQADHRIRVQARRIVEVMKGLAAALKKNGVQLPNDFGAAQLNEREQKWVDAAAKDLSGAKGRALVVVGRRQDPAVHALGVALNDALGSAAVTYFEPFGKNPENFQLGAFAQQIGSGAITTLLILGGNPVFTAPSDLKLEELIPKVATSVHLSTHQDETSKLCTWHIPRAHELESWSDTRAEDGTASIIQPLIDPMWKGKTDAEVLHKLTGGTLNAYDLVRQAYAALIQLEPAPGKIYGQPGPQGEVPSGDAAQPGGAPAGSAPPAGAAPTGGAAATPPDGASANGTSAEFDKAWRKALFDGIVQPTPEGYAEKKKDLAADHATIAQRVQALAAVQGEYEIVFKADPHAYDGRFGNNGWMQETPDPIHKLTWTNAAAISATTAKKLGVVDGDMLTLTVGSGSVKIPAVVTYGHADDSVTVYVGQGRNFSNEVPKSYGPYAGERTPVGICGYDVRPIRQGAGWNIAGGSIAKAGEEAKLAATQTHFLMEGRPVVRHQTLEELRKDPAFARDLVVEEEEKSDLKNSWGDAFTYERGHKWGMTIDLSLCTGCAACVTACVAENNIVVVGPAGVAHHREMHWIRVDRYFFGEEQLFAGIDNPDQNEDDARAVVMPMTCQHCENAPCEQVCPVAATTHSPEGINEMTYNRCIGTKYCGNNCPYKVRRFNFFNYTKEIPDTLKLQLNPDVTVRSRGVMEKCSFCVQRVQEAKIAAKKLRKADGTEGTPEEQWKRQSDFIRTELTTACQQACPSDAIIFGDLNDPQSAVAHADKTPRGYKMLEELNVRPRLTYLARVSNPSPLLGDQLPKNKEKDKEEQRASGESKAGEKEQEKR